MGVVFCVLSESDHCFWFGGRPPGADTQLVASDAAFTVVPDSAVVKSTRYRVSPCGPQLVFSSVAQSCPTLCDPMDCSMPGLPVHHQLPEFTQTHVHGVHAQLFSCIQLCGQHLCAGRWGCRAYAWGVGSGSPCRVKPPLAVCLLARVMMLGGAAASAQICAC